MKKSIDVYTSVGYMLRIDCWEAEKDLKTTSGSDCALNALAIDDPLEYARLAYASFARKAVLSNEELQIVCPKRANDLVAEGRALHHCVGSYIDRVAEGRCLIVFVRRIVEPKKPYVTVEVRDGKIAQIHGDHNSAPTEDVQKFVDLWSRKVLPMALQAA